MRIRKARLVDSRILAEIKVDGFRTAYAGILPPEYLANLSKEKLEGNWREILASERQRLVLVAEMAVGAVAGYASCCLGKRLDDAYDSEVVSLHVRREYQRQGLGSRLLAAVAEQLQQQGCTSLMLWVFTENSARAFYERLGGQLIGEKGWSENERFGLDVREVAYGWPHIESLFHVNQ